MFLVLFASMLIGAGGIGFAFGRYAERVIGPRCAGCRSLAAREALGRLGPRRRPHPGPLR